VARRLVEDAVRRARRRHYAAGDGPRLDVDPTRPPRPASTATRRAVVR
jgi:hypothetical protein